MSSPQKPTKEMKKPTKVGKMMINGEIRKVALDSKGVVHVPVRDQNRVRWVPKK